MLGIELSGGSGCILHIVTEISRRIKIELKRRSILDCFFTVSLLAKASMTNCRFNLSAGVSLCKWRRNRNRRTVENTILPFNKGRISETCRHMVGIRTVRFRFHLRDTDFPVPSGWTIRCLHSRSVRAHLNARIILSLPSLPLFAAHRECAIRWPELHRISRTEWAGWQLCI